MHGSDDRNDARAFRYLAAVCGAVASDRAIPVASLPAMDRADIEEVLALALRHRVAPRAVHALATALQPYDPLVADRLSIHARERCLAALRKAARMAAVSAALSAAGIRHLGIKGPVLAQQLYGDVAARDSKDLDLLVDPAAIAQAAAVLGELGFEDVSLHAEAGERLANKHRTFVGNGVEIELHTRLLDVDTLLPLSFGTVWERRETVMLGAVAVPALALVDTLLYLCAHGAQHLWFRLKWLEDIGRIVALSAAGRHPSIVADAIHAARATRAEAVVVSAVQLAEDVLGIGSVPPVRATRASRHIVRVSKAALAAPADYAAAPPLGWILRKLPVQLDMARDWRYRRDLLRMLILAPRDFDATTLPRGFGWLRLPLRPAMLLRDRWGKRLPVFPPDLSSSQPDGSGTQMSQNIRQTDLDWIELGKHNPYFGVLSNDRYRMENLDEDVLREFFETGEVEIAHFRASIERYFGHLELKTGLDFGCGVGRLVRAMAGHLEHVVGVDVSPGMLARAGLHARSNTTFVHEIPDQQFDWINSTIVFQHIPPARGYPLFHKLLDSVKPGGVFSLHLTFFKDDTYISSLLETIKGGSWDGESLTNTLRTDDGVGAILMYDYDYSKLLIHAVTLRFHEIHLQHTNHGGCHGFVMFGRRS